VSGKAIRDRGWRQCSVASDSLRTAIPEFSASTTPDDLTIVVTHDCDLVSENFEAEPMVELLLARRISDANRDPLSFRGRNPRRLQFELGGHLYEIHARERTSTNRTLLAEHGPDNERTLPKDVQIVLPEWAAKRYIRSALPDAFNDRTKKALKKIRKLLEADADLVLTIFLTLEPNSEVPDDSSYDVLVSVIGTANDILDGVRNSRLQQLTDSMERAFLSCKGIYLRDCRLIRDDEFTLADMNRSIEWDVWDDLSYTENG